MDNIEFAGRRIGFGQRCFIIAEAGVNHNRDVRLAKQLVEAARNAGADAVKFQTWITEKLVASQSVMAAYQKRNLGGDQTQFEMLKGMELSQNDFQIVKEHAEQQGILFLSTPDEEDSADFLEQLGVPLFKIGSAEVTNTPFLKHVARKGKPIILSTGMATLGEVESAVRAIEETGNRQLILLHCVSNYPADPAECNLRAIETLGQAFGYPVGFSDHTLGISIATAAVARGSCVIEKHLTLDKRMAGPDHQASLEPHEFSAMVKAIRETESALGSGVKTPTASEQETKRVVRKRIFAARDIRAGETLTSADLALLRSSEGLSADYLSLILGRQVIQNLDANVPISLADVLFVDTEDQQL